MPPVDRQLEFYVRQRAITLAYSTASEGEPFPAILARAMAIAEWLTDPLVLDNELREAEAERTSAQVN